MSGQGDLAGAAAARDGAVGASRGASTAGIGAGAKAGPPGAAAREPLPDAASVSALDMAASDGSSAAPSRPPAASRKSVLLRLNEPVYEAIARWARDDLRSVNAQIEFLLRRSLETAGRAPTNPGPMPRRGRPPTS
ncbi:MAG: hypothetical protein LBK95_08340 [Bifidobacteriaceae bacterium]|jgi:hypothetical protein|nr:hypothetical protein [Bifidobacteriaceae bacterium]